MSNQRVSSHSSFSSFNWNYDVFLSFRGEDTRTNFTSHLCRALKGRGFNVFMDDKNLESGRPISSQLLNAIEHSRILVIVISRNFISSSWCLNELVKIVECMNTRRQMVIPIFYEVKPSVVIGNFEQEVFARHEKTSDEDMEKVEKWRNALKEVANIAGLGLEDYRNEAEFVESIVEEISSKLRGLRLLMYLSSYLEKLQLQMKVPKGSMGPIPFFFFFFWGPVYLIDLMCPCSKSEPRGELLLLSVAHGVGGGNCQLINGL